MRRRRRFAFAFTLGSAIATFAACTFPDVTFAPDPGEGGPPDAPSGSDGGGDGPAGGDGAADAPEDTTSRTDATQKIDADTCDLATNCDCDNDGYGRAAFTGACDAGKGPDAAKSDCDDLDPLRHPGQGFIDEDPVGQSPPGDWNCDGKVDKNYPESYSCPVTLCSAQQGFKAAVPCGKEAAYFKCEIQTAVCNSVQETLPRRQGCR